MPRGLWGLGVLGLGMCPPPYGPEALAFPQCLGGCSFPNLPTAGFLVLRGLALQVLLMGLLTLSHEEV